MSTPSPSKFRIVKLKEEEILYREGDVAQSMYLVKTGMISVFNQRKGKNFELVRIQAGQLIGELAFFNPGNRTSFAKALVETELIELSFQDLQKDFEKFPPWVKILLNTMSGQVIKFSRELKQFRVAGDEGDPEALNGLMLRYLSALEQTASLYGETKGAGVTVDKNALKNVSTYGAQISSARMNTLAKGLGELGGFDYVEDGDDFKLTIQSLVGLRENLKTFLYYISKHPHLLVPSTEDFDLLTTLAKLCEGQPEGHRGLIKIPSGPVMAALKEHNSKANITNIDGLIDQGLPIQKSSGADGVEIVFPKEDILALSRLWELLAGIQRQGVFKPATS